MQNNPTSRSVADAQRDDQADDSTANPAAELALGETLIEEVSIDGMCGVY
ncbi:mycofactocin precursor MftA [Actinomadura sp. LOL_016]